VSPTASASEPRRKSKLPAKSKEQLAARAAKKEAKRATKQAERRERAQRNRSAPSASRSGRAKRASTVAIETKPHRDRADASAVAVSLAPNVSARSPSEAPSSRGGVVGAGLAGSLKRAMSGSFALLIIALVLLAGLGWFLWPRS